MSNIKIFKNKISFGNWKKKVQKIIYHKSGLFVDDLKDYDYYTAYVESFTPSKVSKIVLKKNNCNQNLLLKEYNDSLKEYNDSFKEYDDWCQIHNEKLKEQSFALQSDVESIYWCWNYLNYEIY